MSRRKQRSAFDQVSKFDRGRIVAYRDCGLSFRKIGSRVGRNQTTLMRIGDRWIQEGTTDRRGQSHPPQCTTSREDRQIVRMAVMDRLVTSRTIAQHIESVTHHSVSPLTIRRRLQHSGLSARRQFPGLPLTQNHIRLRRQWYGERRVWAAEWKEVVFTDESRICLQRERLESSLETPWREDAEELRYAPPYWSCTGQCYISEVLEPVVLPYFQGLVTAIFQQDDARPHVARTVQSFFVIHQIKLLPWPARSPHLSPTENMWSMVAQLLTQITPPAASPDQPWQRMEASFGLLYPKNSSKVSLHQCRGFWQW
ncbi:transposable element Tcb1 transposase [Trichonephila clavipes]|nr:transposable element Tcb1 transposase [Trichonephila clavipes]